MVVVVAEHCCGLAEEAEEAEERRAPSKTALVLFSAAEVVAALLQKLVFHDWGAEEEQVLDLAEVEGPRIFFRQQRVEVL